MRASVVAWSGVAVAACAYACGSFDESQDAPGAPDAAIDVAAADAAGDAGIDAPAPCNGEPEWAVPDGSVPTVATCDGVPGIDLLTMSTHCGRCGHACAFGVNCIDGMCEPRREDFNPSVSPHVSDGVVFYHRSSSREVMRLVEGEVPVVLGTPESEAGGDEILSIAVGAEAVYVRTKVALWKTSKTMPSTASFVASLTSEDNSVMTVAPNGNVIVSARSANRFDSVDGAGNVTPYFEGASDPLESEFTGDRFVWLSQPFLYGSNQPSVLNVREGGTNRPLTMWPQALGGLVIDGNEALMMRTASTGGSIIAVDLTTGAQRSLYDAPLSNAIYQLQLATDATHVYWIKSLDQDLGSTGEIWKRAKCGGAAVRIASQAYIYGLAVKGNSVWFGSQDGLFSVTK